MNIALLSFLTSTGKSFLGFVVTILRTPSGQEKWCTFFYDSPKIRLGLRVDNLTDENYYAGYYFVAKQNPRGYAFNISWKM